MRIELPPQQSQGQSDASSDDAFAGFVAPENGYTYTRFDGTVVHAANQAEAIAGCPFLAEVARNSPEMVDGFFQSVTEGAVPLTPDAILDLINPTKEEIKKEEPRAEASENLGKKKVEEVDKKTKEELFTSDSDGIEGFIEATPQKNTVENAERLVDNNMEYEDAPDEDVDENFQALIEKSADSLIIDDAPHKNISSFEETMSLRENKVVETSTPSVTTLLVESDPESLMNSKTADHAVDAVITQPSIDEVLGVPSGVQETKDLSKIEKIEHDVSSTNEMVPHPPQPAEQTPPFILEVPQADKAFSTHDEAEKIVTQQSDAVQVSEEAKVPKMPTSGTDFQRGDELISYTEYVRPNGAPYEVTPQNTQQFSEHIDNSSLEQEGAEGLSTVSVFVYGTEDEESIKNQPSEPERSDEIEGSRKMQLRTFESGIKIDMEVIDFDRTENNMRLLVFIMEVTPQLIDDQEQNSEAVDEMHNDVLCSEVFEEEAVRLQKKEEKEQIEGFFTQFSLYLLGEIAVPDEMDEREATSTVHDDVREQSKTYVADQIIPSQELAIHTKPSFENEENDRDSETILVSSHDGGFDDQTMDFAKENTSDEAVQMEDDTKAPESFNDGAEPIEILQISFTTEEIEYVYEELSLLPAKPETPSSETPIIEKQEENVTTFASLSDLKHVIEADAEISLITEDVESFKTIQENAPLQPVEQTLVQLTTAYIAEALPKPTEAFFEQIINDMQVELKKTEIYMDSDGQENTPITPQVIENALILLQFAGYAEPAETLLEFAENNGTDKLFQLLSDICELQKLKKKREAILWSIYEPDNFSLGFETVIPDHFIRAVYLPAA